MYNFLKLLHIGVKRSYSCKLAFCDTNHCIEHISTNASMSTANSQPYFSGGYSYRTAAKYCHTLTSIS